MRERVAKHGIGGFARTSGHPSWTFLPVSDTPSCSQWEIKTLFMQEVLARGILSLGTHNVTYAHSDDDVAKLLRVYDEVFPILREAVEEGGHEAVPALRPPAAAVQGALASARYFLHPRSRKSVSGSPGCIFSLSMACPALVGDQPVDLGGIDVAGEMGLDRSAGSPAACADR